jgi:Collagen triple helix repeat (20 copies)
MIRQDHLYRRRAASVKHIRHRITPANAIATVAVFFALGGGAYAAVRLPANSVGTPQIKNRAVTPAKLSAAARRTLVGSPGPTGPSGPVGSIGARGPEGLAGAKGEPGMRGETGMPGSNGTAGPRGLDGEPGSKGERGEQGEKGERGEPGQKGERGEPGQKGERGEPGQKGERGEPGPLLEVLPSGKTLRGTFELRGTAQYLTDSITFQFPLAAAATAYFPASSNVTECPGSVAEPKARPGAFCVYPYTELHVAQHIVFDPSNPVNGRTGKFGAILNIQNSGSEEAFAYGSWAVTAP